MAHRKWAALFLRQYCLADAIAPVYTCPGLFYQRDYSFPRFTPSNCLGILHFKNCIEYHVHVLEPFCGCISALSVSVVECHLNFLLYLSALLMAAGGLDNV